MSDTFSDYNGQVRFAGTLAETGTQTFENVSATGTLQAGTTVTAGSALIGASLSVSGLTGSVVASRYVGQTASGAPSTGAHLVGDFVTTTTGGVFVCSVAGTPGTWVSGALSVFGRTGAVVATAGDYTGVAVGGTADALAALALTNAMVSASAAIGIAKLADPTTGKVIGSAASAAAAVWPPGFEIAYDQITSGVNVASTTEGTPTAIIAGSSKTYENVPYIAEFFSPQVTDSSAAAGTVTILLIADGASIGRIAVSDSVTATTQIVQALTGRLRFTPTAAAHTYGISAFASSATGTPAVGAGAGGINTLVPAFLRITKA